MRRVEWIRLVVSIWGVTEATTTCNVVKEAVQLGYYRSKLKVRIVILIQAFRGGVVIPSEISHWY